MLDNPNYYENSFSWNNNFSYNLAKKVVSLGRTFSMEIGTFALFCAQSINFPAKLINNQ